MFPKEPPMVDFSNALEYPLVDGRCFCGGSQK